MNMLMTTGFRKYSFCAALAGVGLLTLTTQAGAQLSAESVSAAAGTTASVAITINVGSASVINLGATFTAVPAGGAPSTTGLDWTSASGVPNPDLKDNTSVPGSVAVGFVSDISPPLTGTSQLGTVKVPIPAGASGSYTLNVTNVSALDPDGNDVTLTGSPGTITILVVEGPTATPTSPPAAATATPTTKPAVSATPTTKPAASATPTSKPAATATAGGCPTCEDDDGCQIGAVGHSSGWLLLIPAVGLLALRRKRR